LISNGYKLSTDPKRLGWLSPSDPGDPIRRLWNRFHEHGYLWLKGLLDRREVLGFRRRFFTAFQEAGLLAPGTDPAEGFYAGGAEQKDFCHRRLIEAVRWAAYEAFCLSTPMWEFYERALGGPVMLHKRKIIRYTKPGDPSCTGAHYDLTYLRAGTDRVYTCWIPIGDIPVEMGGLLYLEGSHTWGRKMEAEFSAMNAHLPLEERISAYNRNMAEAGWLTKNLPSLADRLEARWLAADYEAGDMVIHSAYTIHAATENRSPQNRMRLSTDIRYQLVDDQADSRWASDWSPEDNL
jgi:ectoine hydroxylase-related dioxygenase (phytanoyl-CoA dioxygenase family)